MTEVLEKTSTAIAEYSATAAALADLRGRMAGVVYDLSTGKGMEVAKKDRAEQQRVADEARAKAQAEAKKAAKAAAKLAAAQRHGPMLMDVLKGTVLPFLENECKDMPADAERRIVRTAIATVEAEGGAA